MPTRLAFGPFTVDVEAGALFDGDRVVRLRPKTWAVLCYLVRHPDRVVSKNELLDAVWPDVTVTEEMAAKCVRELRQALGEKGRGARFLEVVHGRGYRLKAGADRSPHVPMANPATKRAARLQIGIGQRTSLIGRERELAAIDAALVDARAGNSRLLLVRGEAGVGKTRLIAEAVDHAEQQGFSVLVARCIAGDGSPPFWPWVQILRASLGDELAEMTRAPLTHVAGDLTQLLPELRRDRDPPQVQDPEQARFRLFDAAVTLLSRVAEHQPLLLVLDDLHFADASSIALLQALHREARGRALLTLASLSTTEAGSSPKLVDVLTSLRREGLCVDVGLTDLDGGGTRALLEALANAPVEPALAGAIHARTGGNPYFSMELWSHLVDEGAVRADADGWRGQGDAGPVPEGVSATVERRLHRLTAASRALLSAAAVCGTDFDFDLATAAAGLDRAAALDGLEEAIRAGLIIDPVERAGGFRFVHGLTVETILRDLSAVRMAHLHWRVAELLEAADGEKVDAAMLARHAVRGAQRGDWERAVSHARRAAAHSAAACAYESAAAHFEAALGVVDALAPSGEATNRLRLELSLAAADSHSCGGDETAARARYDSARAMARDLGDVASLARAALGTVTRWTFADSEAIASLEEALAAVADRDPEMTARLEARLAQALYFTPATRSRRERLCEQALARAREVDDAGLIGDVLNDSLEAMFHSDNRIQQQSLATALYAAARRCDNQRLLLRAHAWRIVVSFCRGRLREAEAEVDTVLALARDLRQPQFLGIAHSFVAALAIARGEFGVAEEQAKLSVRLSQRINQDAASMVWFTQMFTIRREQGRSTGFEGRDGVRLPEMTGIPGEIFRKTSYWSLPFALIEEGDVERGREEFDALMEDLDDLPRENARNTRLMALASLGQVAAHLNDREAARRLLPLVRPYADQWMVVGFGTLVLASMKTAVGALLATVGDFDEAFANLDGAIAEHEREGAVVAQARALATYAAAVLRRGTVGDDRKAADLVERGLALADRYELRSSGNKLRHLAAECGRMRTSSTKQGRNVH